MKVEMFETTKVTGICPACGQPARLTKIWGEEKYFWEHDNFRDSYVHGATAPDAERRVPVDVQEARRLIELAKAGKRSLIGHSDSVVCVQTGEVYRNKWTAAAQAGIHASALGNALNNGRQAGGNYWRYAEHFWLTLDEPKEDALPDCLSGPAFMDVNEAVPDPVSFLRKGCPECGSQLVKVEGRTMLPALMESRGIIIAARLTKLTGVDKQTIGRLKKWSSCRPAKDMDAAKAIADEFGVPVEYLLSLDPEDYRLQYFWESPPSRVVCRDCHYRAQWETWVWQLDSSEM